MMSFKDAKLYSKVLSIMLKKTNSKSYISTLRMNYNHSKNYMKDIKKYSCKSKIHYKSIGRTIKTMLSF